MGVPVGQSVSKKAWIKRARTEEPGGERLPHRQHSSWVVDSAWPALTSARLETEFNKERKYSGCGHSVSACVEV